MTLQGFFESFTTGGWIAIVCAVLTLIEITPIKVNPWKSLVEWIGRGLNAGTIADIKKLQSQVKDIKDKLDAHIEEDEKQYTDACRTKILDFAGESLRGIRHTLEQYNRILDRIDVYEHYCNTHPDYPNNKCLASIAVIKERHTAHLRDKDFLDSQGHKD